MNRYDDIHFGRKFFIDCLLQRLIFCLCQFFGHSQQLFHQGNPPFAQGGEVGQAQLGAEDQSQRVRKVLADLRRPGEEGYNQNENAKISKV